jgi:hypothetical protein
MIRKSGFVAFALALALVVWSGAAIAADQAANVAGSWTMSVQTRRGTMDQAMTIQQDGNTIKGTLQGRRGDTPFQGSVDGNKITFNVTRQTQRGTFTMKYDGTIDGDSMKGTASNGRFNMDWTAKRGAAPGQ